MMNNRKMSRRTALALTIGAATGAAILSDVQPADATWPTITSPDEVLTAATTVSTATKRMQQNWTKPPVKYQKRDIDSWDVVEVILVAAAAAVAQNKESNTAWHWKRRSPHGSKH